MKLSKRCEYGLRALMDLSFARHAGRERIQIREIAQHERIPVKFLEQILLALKEAGWLTSKRGKNGGYALTPEGEAVPVGTIVRHLDGPLAPISCVSKGGYAPCTCPDEDHCGLRLLMLDLHAAMSRLLDRTTLADMAEVTLRRFRRDGIAPPFGNPGGPKRRPATHRRSPRSRRGE